MEKLYPLPNQDAYATKSFFGIIYGNELAEVANNKIDLKALILQRLKLAYEEAIREYE